MKQSLTLVTATLFLLCCVTLSPSASAKEDKKKKATDLCDKGICALYETTARGKAAWKCGLRKYKGNCACTKTTNTCGTNWRKKTKYIFSCVCRPICRKTVCGLYSLTARVKAARSCGWSKGYKTKKCKCKKTTSCGKNWRGATKHNYNCKCK